MQQFSETCACGCGTQRLPLSKPYKGFISIMLVLDGEGSTSCHASTGQTCIFGIQAEVTCRMIRTIRVAKIFRTFPV